MTIRGNQIEFDLLSMKIWTHKLGEGIRLIEWIRLSLNRVLDRFLITLVSLGRICFPHFSPFPGPFFTTFSALSSVCARWKQILSKVKVIKDKKRGKGPHITSGPLPYHLSEPRRQLAIESHLGEKLNFSQPPPLLTETPNIRETGYFSEGEDTYLQNVTRNFGLMAKNLVDLKSNRISDGNNREPEKWFQFLPDVSQQRRRQMLQRGRWRMEPRGRKRSS